MTEQGLPRPEQGQWRWRLDDWDRALGSANRPLTTRYNYELAVTQLARFLDGDEFAERLDTVGIVDDDTDAATDPTDVQTSHVQWFLAWMIETRSASTALNKYKAQQQFFNYLLTRRRSCDIR